MFYNFAWYSDDIAIGPPPFEFDYLIKQIIDPDLIVVTDPLVLGHYYFDPRESIELTFQQGAIPPVPELAYLIRGLVQ